jgi:hypothetical protein
MERTWTEGIRLNPTIVRKSMGNFRRLRQLLATALGLGLVSAALVVVLPTSPAAAAGLLLQRVNGSTETDSRPYKSVTIYCPGGGAALSANYSIIGAPGKVVLDDLIISQGSVTVAAGEIVGVGEAADGTPENWRVQATAVCTPWTVTYYQATSGFAVGSSRYVTVNCPAGQQVIGLGASLAQGFGQVSISNLWVGESSVTAIAHADDDGFSGSWSVTAYAVCASNIGQEVVHGPTNPSTLALSSSGLCPSTKQLVGVGWEQTGGGEVYVTTAKADSDFLVATVPDETGANFTWYTGAMGICINK